METDPWPVHNKSETLEDRLSKNCERELACGGRAGTCSGSVNSISGGEGSGKPGGTLCPPMSGVATEPTSTSLAIVGNPGLLVRSSG